ncbi:4-hydroxy-tetrahydrodipicolinate reductase [Bowdeniella massiliensis]|uniref:4-hydroxy-tetrahydrodipicolinate reductase n=1 Tax=Bowdeniella massiliensis TaxID=2932264 RepID=UPI00202837C6|nr:4-hydroxy-tetrahydrodipicolinate reductase [Bowdeniella massiliensis]
MITVAVSGAHGRMGSTVVQAVSAANDLELVAELDHEDEISTDTVRGADVLVDFTVPAAAQTNVLAGLAAGCHVVVGTTGWTPQAIDSVRQAAVDSGRNVIIAPNFALSAVLAMHFAALAAPYFESAEVIELHHPNKLDAPSGTAQATAKKIAEARGSAPMPDATEHDPQNTRGGLIDGVRVHALRISGLTAHEEILLGNPGELLTIRTDSFDRASFMPGVLLAIRKISQLQPLTYGLDQVMDLPGR